MEPQSSLVINTLHLLNQKWFSLKAKGLKHTHIHPKKKNKQKTLNEHTFVLVSYKQCP